MGPNEIWLGFVGRLTAEKGVDVLLRALVANPGPDGLLVVGDGPDRPALEATARRGRVPVRFCGFQDDVSPLLAKSPGGMYRLTLSFRRPHVAWPCEGQPAPPETEETLAVSREQGSRGEGEKGESIASETSR